MSARVRRGPTSKKAENVPGTTMNDWAKMIGMTPAEFTRMGMKLF